MVNLSRPGVVFADIMQPDRNSFGVVRLAMAVAVLISHSYFFVTGQSTAEPLVSVTGHSLGEHGVQVFFFLSGVLVTQSLFNSGSVIDFAVARSLRIFPGLIVCVLATALLLGPFVSALAPTAYYADAGLWVYIAKTLLLTTGGAPLPGVFQELPAASLFNMSLWTLKYEVMCYVALGLAGAMGALRGHNRRFAIAAVGLLVGFVFIGQPKHPDSYSQIDNIRYFTLYFATGVLACLIKDQLVLSWGVLVGLGAVFAAMTGTRFGELSCALFLGYATLMAASLDFGWLTRWTRTTDISFGVYIYAAPIQQSLLLALPSLTPLALSAIAGAIAVGVALASWEFVERVALRGRQPVTRSIQGMIEALFPRTLVDAGRLSHVVRRHNRA